jgi:hypothetical protein
MALKGYFTKLNIIIIRKTYHNIEFENASLVFIPKHTCMINEMTATIKYTLVDTG